MIHGFGTAAQGPRSGQYRTHGFVVSKQGQVLVLRRDFDKPGIGGQGLGNQIDSLPSIIFMFFGHQGMDARRLVSNERIRVYLDRGVGVLQGRVAVSLAGQQHAARRHGPGIAWFHRHQLVQGSDRFRSVIQPFGEHVRHILECRRGPRVDGECLAKVGKCFVRLIVQAPHLARPS